MSLTDFIQKNKKSAYCKFSYSLVEKIDMEI